MSESLNIFIGVDKRQPIAYSVLQDSIVFQSSKPVSIRPLIYGQHPITRRGLTDFTYARFAAPYLCRFKGWSLFVDADMVLRDDIAKLFELADDKYAVQVVKSEHRFEWPSLMLFNNEKCTTLTPEWINDEKNNPFKLEFGEVGGLPEEWNHIVPYSGLNPDAKLVHYTQGIPCWPETEHCEHADEWVKHARHSMSTVSWFELMGQSVHAQSVVAQLKALGKVKA